MRARAGPGAPVTPCLGHFVRMPRGLLLLAILVAAALPPAAAAGMATRPDARAVTKATLRFDLARGKAIGRADRRGDQRRTAAQACLGTLQHAPAGRRDELFGLYLTYLEAGYFAEDAPLFSRWIRALDRVPLADARLRTARTTLGRQLAGLRRTSARGQAFCGPVRAWAHRRWKDGGRPTALKRLVALARRTAGGPPRAGLAAAARHLEAAGGPGGALAGSVLREGISEPSDRVVEGRDPVVAALVPGAS